MAFAGVPLRMNWNSPDLRGRRQLGLALFLISLAMLFGASIAAFAYLRLTSPGLPGSERIELPLVLIVSTAVLLGAGLAVYQATQNAKRGHFPLLRRWLARAWVTSALFIAVQIPALIQLLDRHRALEGRGYGIAFALIAIHALHVVGGMVPLSMLAWKARLNRLDSEHLLSVRACAAYWHFLEVVWVALLGAFFLWG